MKAVGILLLVAALLIQDQFYRFMDWIELPEKERRRERRKRARKGIRFRILKAIETML